MTVLIRNFDVSLLLRCFCRSGIWMVGRTEGTWSVRNSPCGQPAAGLSDCPVSSPLSGLHLVSKSYKQGRGILDEPSGVGLESEVSV